MAHALRQALFVLVVLALGLGLWRWVARPGSAPAAPPRELGPVPVTTHALQARGLARRIEVFGNLEPRAVLPLESELPGRLERVHPAWRPGGRVAEGELVLALDPRPLELEREAHRAALEEARAGLAAARSEETRARRALDKASERRTIAVREHERVAALVTDGVVSESMVDQALTARIASEQAVEAAEAALDAALSASAAAIARQAGAESTLAAAEDRLRRSRFLAPFSGEFDARGPEVGAFVAPGQPLGALVDLSRLLFAARVPSDELLQLREGLPVDVELAGRPELGAGLVLRGEIVALSPRVDVRTRHGIVEIEVANPGRRGPEEEVSERVPAGLFARATLELEATDELWIDRRHFAWRGGAPVAFRLEDGRARRSELVFEREHGEGFVLRAGLSPGDVLITAPLERLVDGTPVSPVEDAR